MQSGLEQRFKIKIFVKVRKSATEARAMLKAVYGNECSSRTQVFDVV